MAADELAAAFPLMRLPSPAGGSGSASPSSQRHRLNLPAGHRDKMA